MYENEMNLNFVFSAMGKVAAYSTTPTTFPYPAQATGLQKVVIDSLPSHRNSHNK